MGFIRICGFCLFLFVFQNPFSDFENVAVQGCKNTRIRVINNSEHSFIRVTLFSMYFGDLMPKDTSEYRKLNYDSLKDDPLIYCVTNEKNYGRYLDIPRKDVRRFTYVIDSLRNQIVYVSSQVDE